MVANVNAASKDEARRATAQLTATRVYHKVVETVRERNACFQNQTSGKTDYSLRAVAMNESIVTTMPSEPQLLKRYAEDIGVTVRKVRRICAQRAVVGTTKLWKFQRKVRKDVTNPETLEHIRRFLMTNRQPRNAGVATATGADCRGAWNRDFMLGNVANKETGHLAPNVFFGRDAETSPSKLVQNCVGRWPKGQSRGIHGVLERKA